MRGDEWVNRRTAGRDMLELNEMEEEGTPGSRRNRRGEDQDKDKGRIGGEGVIGEGRSLRVKRRRRERGGGGVVGGVHRASAEFNLTSLPRRSVTVG